ncbi:MAG: glycoside hydrolase family 13 protein [Lachnospiraceae bacterium]|nr:glycoside hydrolase family 13 protein [Lachnospiraceae bacterium]
MAVFSDETTDYRYPFFVRSGDRVIVRLRLLKGCGAKAFLCRDGAKEEPLRPDGSDSLFSYWAASFVVGEQPERYRFLVCMEDRTYLYDKQGLHEGDDAGDPFVVTPDFYVPAWALGAVMYQIFVDRFRDGDPDGGVENGEYLYAEGRPVVRVTDWNAPVEADDVGRFYGGDLAGVIEKLDYLKYLGVECIYLNPIFVSPSNHKYDSQDYTHVDPHFGRIVKDGGEPVPPWAKDNRGASKYRIRTTDPENLAASDGMLEALITEAHERGIRVILDGVFNHCGSFHKWMDREGIYADADGKSDGAFWRADSPYRDYFRFRREDEGAWPGNDSYEAWWEYETLPKLNYEGSEALTEEILSAAEKWVSAPYGADGWRLDVAADLGHGAEANHAFWQAFRKRVRSANPEAVILAEHYGDAAPWLAGNEWDTVMNYDAFMEPVSFFLTGMEKHSDHAYPDQAGDASRFFYAMRRGMARFQNGSLLSAMNELSNHDHSRFMTRTNGRVGRLAVDGAEAASQGVRPTVFRLGVLMQFTWPGAPTIYYGDEAGLCGFTDPDSRRPYPWGSEDMDLIEYHRYLGILHRRHKALRTGSLIPLVAEQGMIAYARTLREEAVIVAVNQSGNPQTAWVPAWLAGVEDGMTLERVLYTNPAGYDVGRTPVRVKDGYAALDLKPESGMILVKRAHA